MQANERMPDAALAALLERLPWLLELAPIAEETIEARGELGEILTVPPRTVADEDAIIATLALQVSPLCAAVRSLEARVRELEADAKRWRVFRNHSWCKLDVRGNGYELRWIEGNRMAFPEGQGPTDVDAAADEYEKCGYALAAAMVEIEAEREAMRAAPPDQERTPE